MDKARHFDISSEGRVVVIRCYGTWIRETAVQLLSSLEDFIPQFDAQFETGMGWATLVDFSEWQPATPDVTDVANQIRDMLVDAGRTHGGYLFGSLEAARLMIEKKVIDPASTTIQYFQNEDFAREWFRSLGYLDE